ncbi:MAG: hypothetical protein JSW55_13455 [Chloroflexota bacterium]|nr:MAG: hypothetical protein JSW55_13455 [Chloroflexota bacterium]
MSSKRREVASVMIRADRPTDLTFAELYTWVIWQFPRPKGAGLCGAVRPPIANHSWFPALIKSRDGQAVVYGHVKREFATPAQAADWLEAQST